MSFEKTIMVPSGTGASLSLRMIEAGDAKAIIILCHGLAEHAARYGHFAEFLASRHYHVLCHDHRGHGYTTAPDAVPGRFARQKGARAVIDDVAAVRNFAANRYPGLPIILFGHSMGGIIAAATAETLPQAFDALAIWNADLNPGAAGRLGRQILRAERFLKGSDVPSAFAPKFTFDIWARSISGAHTPFDWLSHDETAVAAYISDPLCGFAPSVSMWLDVLELATRAGSRDALSYLPRTLPVHIAGASEDAATNGGKAMRWLAGRMKNLGMSRIALTIHDGMRHETLHEIGREDAMRHFADWADGVVYAAERK